MNDDNISSGIPEFASIGEPQNSRDHEAVSNVGSHTWSQGSGWPVGPNADDPRVGGDTPALSAVGTGTFAGYGPNFGHVAVGAEVPGSSTAAKTTNLKLDDIKFGSVATFKSWQTQLKLTLIQWMCTNFKTIKKVNALKFVKDIGDLHIDELLKELEEFLDGRAIYTTTRWYRL